MLSRTMLGWLKNSKGNEIRQELQSHGSVLMNRRSWSRLSVWGGDRPSALGTDSAMCTKPGKEQIFLPWGIRIAKVFHCV
jgi:hypothetical protein